MGVAYAGFNIADGLYPAWTMRTGQHCTVNFGTTIFMYGPPDGYSAITYHKYALCITIAVGLTMIRCPSMTSPDESDASRTWAVWFDRLYLVYSVFGTLVPPKRDRALPAAFVESLDFKNKLPPEDIPRVRRTL